VPLPAPILDDRSWRELRDELVARIPVYTPEWTDHNASDPGVTLLELFAFLGENLLFRFNQIPESTQLEFLRLLDIPLRPAQAAEAMVAFETRQAAGELVEQHEREVLAGSTPYEVLTETYVLPVTLAGVMRERSPDPAAGEERDQADLALDAAGLRAGDAATYYRARRLPADPAAPDAAPLDFDDSVDGVLWLAVVPGKDATLDALRGHVLNVGVLPADEAPPMAEVDACPGRGAQPSGAALVWEASTGERDTHTGEPRYRPLRVAGDTTGGFAQPGVVRLELPALGPLGQFTLADSDEAGTGSLPPSLDDDDLEASVLFWVRAYRPSDVSLGRILWAGANAASVRQQRRAGPEFLGTGTGDAGQRMRLVNPNVVAGSLALEVEEPDGWRRWDEVDSFVASAPDDRHYVLDAEAGELQFGGMQGRPPQIGERVRATSYRHGGGAAGNAGPKGISKVDGGATLKVANPLPATGGADAESIASGLERIAGELRRRDRAVTADDFSELALATPGAGVARAECLARFHPRHAADFEAAGVVSVVVWPQEDRRHPSAPLPDRTLLRRVCRWLDERRLVTTELYVIPPTYRRVAVAVGLEVGPGAGVEAVRAWVELVLRQYLAPLPPYGPGGGGWPLGRRVHGPELEAAALQVDGVEYLTGLRVAGLADDGTWHEGTIELRRFEVPELAEITVVEGDPLEPGKELQPVAQPPGVPIPIPPLRTEC
jgi:predicted phage baseplate assembly protein